LTIRTKPKLNVLLAHFAPVKPGRYAQVWHRATRQGAVWVGTLRLSAEFRWKLENLRVVTVALCTAFNPLTALRKGRSL
jgi:hypothetical protein